MATLSTVLGECVTTLWGLQERRFATVFEVVSSVARSLTMALVFCFSNLHHRGRGGELGAVLL